MINIIEQISYFFGMAICHQLPERTFMINGQYLPICARDTGIYIGILSSLMYIFITAKHRSNTIPTIRISMVLLFLLFPLVVDGFGSYLGIYSTTNLIRLITGILFGLALPFFLVPLLSLSSFLETERPILTRLREIIYPLIISSFFASLAYFSLLPIELLYLMTIGTLICWISLLFLLFYKRLSRRYIAVFLSFMSSLAILTALSFIHKFIQTFI